MTDKQKYYLQRMVGRVSKMMDAGMGVTEICTILKKPESSVREWMDIVKQARANEAAIEG